MSRLQSGRMRGSGSTSLSHLQDTSLDLGHLLDSSRKSATDDELVGVLTILDHQSFSPEQDRKLLKLAMGDFVRELTGSDEIDFDCEYMEGKRLLRTPKLAWDDNVRVEPIPISCDLQQLRAFFDGGSPKIRDEVIKKYLGPTATEATTGKGGEGGKAGKAGKVKEKAVKEKLKIRGGKGGGRDGGLSTWSAGKAQQKGPEQEQVEPEVEEVEEEEQVDQEDQEEQEPSKAGKRRRAPKRVNQPLEVEEDTSHADSLPKDRLNIVRPCYDCAWLSLTALSTVTCNLWL
jgi:hypothetical protein